VKKKFEHTTCKENWRKEADMKKNISSPFAIYVLILVFIYLLALILFFKNSFFDFSMFSYWIGVGSWMVFYMNSQQIIDKNQFKQFTILSLLILILSALLLIVTKSSFLNFLMTGFPFFYIVYFRLLLFLFYKGFINTYKKPIILFASKGGNWKPENPTHAYNISKKEIIFSDLLFFGPILFAGVVAYFILQK
jgi:hypothetical protein